MEGVRTNAPEMKNRSVYNILDQPPLLTRRRERPTCAPARSALVLPPMWFQRSINSS